MNMKKNAPSGDAIRDHPLYVRRKRALEPKLPKPLPTTVDGTLVYQALHDYGNHRASSVIDNDVFWQRVQLKMMQQHRWTDLFVNEADRNELHRFFSGLNLVELSRSKTESVGADAWSTDPVPKTACRTQPIDASPPPLKTTSSALNEGTCVTVKSEPGHMVNPHSDLHTILKRESNDGQCESAGEAHVDLQLLQRFLRQSTLFANPTLPIYSPASMNRLKKRAHQLVRNTQTGLVKLNYKLVAHARSNNVLSVNTLNDLRRTILRQFDERVTTCLQVAKDENNLKDGDFDFTELDDVSSAHGPSVSSVAKQWMELYDGIDPEDFDDEDETVSDPEETADENTVEFLVTPRSEATFRPKSVVRNLVPETPHEWDGRSDSVVYLTVLYDLSEEHKSLPKPHKSLCVVLVSTSSASFVCECAVTFYPLMQQQPTEPMTE